MDDDSRELALYWLTVGGFVVTYLGLAVGKVPGLRIDRTGIALVGATFFLAVGAIGFEPAMGSINHATIVLLFAMMIVVAHLRLAGFFERLIGWALDRFREPVALLAVTIALSGTLSAFLVNDVVCVALTPLVLHLTRRLGIDPVPHLVGLATAANIGSTATITGNPQNIIIGNLSGISYLRFIERLGPIALIGLAVDFLVVTLVYRSALAAPPKKLVEVESERQKSPPARRGLLIKSLAVTLGAVVLFFAGLPIALVALGAAALLLLDRIRPEKVYRQVDWPLLVMFCALFIVVRAFEIRVVGAWGLENWTVLQSSPVSLLSVVSAALSNLVSNVPAVLLFKPVIPAMPEARQETAWLALAMSSTLAGNLTVLGSVANLIVVEVARREGVELSFWEFCRAGVPVTILTLLIGVAWLSFL